MTSQNFSSKAGSFHILKVRTMWGFRSFFFQIWCTLCREIPTSFAMLRTLQRVLPFGGWVTRVMTASTFGAGNDGLRPRPGASASPARPSAINRPVHLLTHALLTPRLLATSSCLEPSARNKMISALRASRLELLCALARRSSSVFSLSSNWICNIGRPRRTAFVNLF